MRYSVQPRDRILVKGYGFFSFAKNMGKNVGKNIIKNLRCKYSPKRFDNTTRSATDSLSTSSIRCNSKYSRSNWWLD